MKLFHIFHKWRMVRRIYWQRGDENDPSTWGPHPVCRCYRPALAIGHFIMGPFIWECSRCLKYKELKNQPLEFSK